MLRHIRSEMLSTHRSLHFGCRRLSQLLAAAVPDVLGMRFKSDKNYISPVLSASNPCSSAGASYNRLYKYGYKSLHTSPIEYIKFRKERRKPDPVEESRVTRKGYFKGGAHDKENFVATIQVYRDKEKLLRGHVEFINAALRHMELFNVHKDLEVYKELLNVFPKAKMIPENMLQVEFMHYPLQQDCAINVLHQMENFGVIPDTEVQDIIMNTFGFHSHPMKKYGRMMYWMHKFNNASPWPLPKPVPDDALELAKLAVARMCSVDQTSEISVLETKDVKDSIDDTWIVSGQSGHQIELMDKQPEDKPLKVRGPFRIFLREQSVNYFTLTADYIPPPKVEEIDKDDISFISSLLQEDGGLKPNTAITTVASVHEQQDGTILSICVTGTSSRDSLLSWVRLLAETNLALARGLPVIFMQTSPQENTELVSTDDQELGLQSTQSSNNNSQEENSTKEHTDTQDHDDSKPR